MSISASIVAYCDYEEVCAAARSILRFTPQPDFSLYLIDNASPDGCGKALKSTDFGDPRVQVLCLAQNVGFGRGHNTVLPLLQPAGSEIHFILNPDVLLQNDCLNAMADWLRQPEHAGVVMATPQLYYPDGRIQHLPRRKPTPWLLLARQLAPRFGGRFAKADRHYTMQDENLSQPHTIAFCTGSFAAVRTADWCAVGGFDEDYFMYVEDADLTQKMLTRGSVMLLPQCSAVHAWHRDPMRDAGKFKMQLGSMLRYFRKWGVGSGPA